jgi:hypothetical protein
VTAELATRSPPVWPETKRAREKKTFENPAYFGRGIRNPLGNLGTGGVKKTTDSCCAPRTTLEIYVVPRAERCACRQVHVLCVTFLPPLLLESFPSCCSYLLLPSIREAGTRRRHWLAFRRTGALSLTEELHPLSLVR